MNKDINPLIKFTKKQRIDDRKKLFLMVLVLCFLFIFSLSVGEISLFPDQWLTDEAHLFV